MSVWSDYSNWSQHVTVDDQPKKPLLYSHDGQPLAIGLRRIGYTRK